MQWIAVAIRRFLTTQAEWDRGGFRGSEEMWMKAIGRSGFVQTLGVTYSPEAKLAVVSLGGENTEAA